MIPVTIKAVLSALGIPFASPSVEKLPEEDFLDRFWEEHKILRWPVIIIIALVVSFVIVTMLNIFLPDGLSSR